ncbi:phosphotransferase family protein [Parvularcula sp. ZS-1/3]|uniref:Phosphotransferase family protein n=1 Tax=Parvularcula mediterranea TaxID=2732508 RepID=A0A7Y3RLB1_9PROT|nr:phosphotransferase family protein [Parvularcula mediterranea]NNU15447.1 phosphotransferase family protein [Parvularcula mediterranea]
MASDFSGLGDVPDHLAFDVEGLKKGAGAAVPGLTGEISVKKFKGGQSNPTYLIETSEGRYVLRRKPPGKLLGSAHQVGREAKVMSALRDTDVPVPNVLFHTEDPEMIGSEFFIMEFMDGRIFWDPLLKDLPKEERSEVYFGLTDTLAALHSVNYKDVGLGDFGPEGDYIARQVGRWSKQYKASETDDVEAMNWLIDWLPKNIPADDKTCLIHGDFRLDNCMMAKGSPTPIGLIDWELSTLGHPLADLTYYLLSWKIPLDPSRGDSLVGQDLESMNIPREEALIDRYREKTGADIPDDLNFYFSYNLFRLAGIVQGVYKRAKDGNASSEKALSYGKMTAPLAMMAKQFAGG